MIRFAIDTNTYSFANDGDARTVEQFRIAEQIFVPFIVLGELRYGFAYGRQAEQNEEQLRLFLKSPRVQILFADQETTHIYGDLMAQLRKRGTMIPINDIWIAALVVQHQLPLFARDAHFDRLPQVQRI